MYPFANLTFDQMVNQYLPRAAEIYATNDLDEWKKVRIQSLYFERWLIHLRQIPLFYMFIRGHYDDIYALNQIFGPKFMLIDGEQFKHEPWVALEQIESAFGLDPFFTKERFGQRDDGFYCIKSPSKVSLFWIFWSDSKLRSKNYRACQVTRASQDWARRWWVNKRVQNWKTFIHSHSKSSLLFIIINYRGCKITRHYSSVDIEELEDDEEDDDEDDDEDVVEFLRTFSKSLSCTISLLFLRSSVTGFVFEWYVRCFSFAKAYRGMNGTNQYSW